MTHFFDALIVLAFLILVYTLAGCVSDPIPEGTTQAEPETIIQGAEGILSWILRVDLGIIDPIELSIGASRSKSPETKKEVSHIIE